MHPVIRPRPSTICCANSTSGERTASAWIVPNKLRDQVAPAQEFEWLGCMEVGSDDVHMKRWGVKPPVPTPSNSEHWLKSRICCEWPSLLCSTECAGNKMTRRSVMPQDEIRAASSHTNTHPMLAIGWCLIEHGHNIRDAEKLTRHVQQRQHTLMGTSE
jgi:hypothetical protein